MNAWLKRHQEFFGWMPLLLIVAVGAWVLLGAVSDRDDLIRWLLELPVKSLYAAAASGVAYLVWRRWSYRMNDDELRAYWAGLLAGAPGPMVIYLVNAAFYLCVFAALLVYFAR